MPSKSVMFVRGNRESVVWDPKNNRSLATFIDGLFETSDKGVISILKDAGYLTVEEYGGTPPPLGFKDPDRGPVIDVANHDVRTAKTEAQELANAKRLEMQKRLEARARRKAKDDDIEYAPPKKKKKSSKNGKSLTAK